MAEQRIQKAFSLMESALSIISAEESVNNVWQAYLNIEHAIALLKLEYGDDFPAEKPAKSQKVTLLDAKGAIEEAAKEVSSSNIESAIIKARYARDMLAEILYSLRG